MAKMYKGSLSLDWYNKQKAIILQNEKLARTEKDIPAPIINWINKEDALFYEIKEEDGKGVSPYWVNRNDIRVKEARPLILKSCYRAIPKDQPGSFPGFNTQWEVEQLENEIATENILIKGDNLIALNSLKKHFDKYTEQEKVKCIYVDPPFNTGQAFEHYDDNLAHSEWLTLMRDRLIVLKSLLRYDGFIVVHLDSIEVHYCKVMLDEIFGRDCFVSHIAYERSSVAGLGQGGLFVNTAESILVYHNGEPKSNLVYEIESLPIKTMKRYNKYVESFGERELVKEFVSKSNGQPVRIFKHSNYIIKTISTAKAEERYEQLIEEYKTRLETIFRPFLVQEENEFQHEILSYMDKESFYSVDYIPSRGKNKDQNTTLYYNDKGLVAWLKDTTEDSADGLGKKTRLSNFWRHSEIPKADLHNEGGVSFARNKKPENLLQRIIEFSTDEGDTVLDCFAGSGTTLSVAHKMNRRWIGIEIGNHIDTHIIPRLTAVLNGSDNTGVSKTNNWKGGGAFKYYHIGPSIISSSQDKQEDFNWDLGKKFIEESMLLSYDYTLETQIDIQANQLFKSEQDRPTIGIQQIGSKSRVAIVSINEPNGKLSIMPYDEISALYQAVKQKFAPEYINIFTNRGIEMAFDSKPDDLEIIKVPHAIFAELEK